MIYYILHFARVEMWATEFVYGTGTPGTMVHVFIERCIRITFKVKQLQFIYNNVV